MPRPGSVRTRPPPPAPQALSPFPRSDDRAGAGSGEGPPRGSAHGQSPLCSGRGGTGWVRGDPLRPGPAEEEGALDGRDAPPSAACLGARNADPPPTFGTSSPPIPGEQPGAPHTHPSRAALSGLFSSVWETPRPARFRAVGSGMFSWHSPGRSPRRRGQLVSRGRVLVREDAPRAGLLAPPTAWHGSPGPPGFLWELGLGKPPQKRFPWPPPCQRSQPSLLLTQGLCLLIASGELWPVHPLGGEASRLNQSNSILIRSWVK